MKRIYKLIIFCVFLLPLGAITVHAAAPVTSPFGTDSLLNGVVLKNLSTGLPAPELTDRDTDTYKQVQWSNSGGKYTYTFPDLVGIDRVWTVGSKGNYFYADFTFDDGTKKQVSFNTSSFPLVATETVLDLPKPVRSFVIYGSGGSPYLHELDFSKIKDTTPPHKPTGITAVAGFDQVNLSWDINTDKDIFAYNIYVDGVKENKVAIRVNSYSVNLNDYTRTYSFFIRAIDTSGNESVSSDSVISTPIEPPDITPPSRPYGLKATAEVGQVSLTWSPNIEPDLAGYLIYKDGRLLFTTPITATDFIVTGGMSYTDDSEFSIVAVDFTGNVSIRSTVVKVKPIKPIDNTPPDIPLGLTAALTPDFLKIRTEWLAVTNPDLDGYYIYVSKDGGNNWIRTNPPPVRITRYDIEPIEPDTEYQIKVIAIDFSGNESGFSNTVKIKTPSKNTVVTPGPSTPDYMDITWLPIPGAEKYFIYYNGKRVGEAPPGTTTFRITKVMGYNPNGMLQVVDVRAQFANGSIGGGSNQPGKPIGTGWGFTAADIFTNSIWLIVSVSSLVLFGLVMKFTPKLITLIKKIVIRRRRRME